MKKIIKELEEVPKFKITKAIDLFTKLKEEPEPKEVWNGIIEGSKGLIVGVSKTGKTTLAENLAISLAVGKSEFFGYTLSGKPEKVLFINLEESYRVRGRRNLKQIEVLSSDEVNSFENNYFSTPTDFPEFMNNESDWKNLHDYIESVDPKYVFIDSLSHLFEGQIENSDSSIKFIKRFRDNVGSLGKTVIIVHHNTKTNDKPITQSSIAGSRVIPQEFEYAIGLANVPTNKGGSYLCKLYNKYSENDENQAILYKVDQYNWVQNIGEANKFDLYQDIQVDYRFDSSNKDLVYDYFTSKLNQSSQDTQHSIEVSTSELSDKFIISKKVSKDTLHKCLKKLVSENKIYKKNRGIYSITKNEENGRDIQSN